MSTISEQNENLECTHTNYFILALLVLLLGFVVIVGCFTGNTALVQVSPKYGPMQFNAAFAFVLIALGLICTMSHRSVMGAMLGFVVIFIAVLTSIQDVYDINLGIDQLFIKTDISTKSSAPGRMGPNTTSCFILTGLILVIHYYYKRYSDRRVILFLFFMAIAVIFFSWTALVGYFADLRNLYGWGAYTHMGVHTAIGFIVWGGCFTVWLKTRSADALYKKSLFLPVASFIVCIFIFGVFSQLLADREYKELQSVLKINEKYIFELFMPY